MDLVREPLEPWGWSRRGRVDVGLWDTRLRVYSLRRDCGAERLLMHFTKFRVCPKALHKQGLWSLFLFHRLCTNYHSFCRAQAGPSRRS